MIIIDPLNNFKNIDYKSLSAILNLLDPVEFAIVGSIIGIVISLPMTSLEQNAVGNFLILIGQEMLTIQAHQFNKSSNIVTNTDFEKYKNDLNLKLEKIIKNHKL